MLYCSDDCKMDDVGRHQFECDDFTISKLGAEDKMLDLSRVQNESTYKLENDEVCLNQKESLGLQVAYKQPATDTLSFNSVLKRLSELELKLCL